LGNQTGVIHTSAQSPGLAFSFQQRQDVAHANRSFDIPNNLAALVAEELHPHLGALPLGSSASKDLDHASVLRLVHAEYEIRELFDNKRFEFEAVSAAAFPVDENRKPIYPSIIPGATCRPCSAT